MNLSLMQMPWICGFWARIILRNLTNSPQSKQLRMTSTQIQKKIVELNRTRMGTGDVNQVTSQLEEISTSMLVDELLLIPLVPSFDARKEAVRILTDHFLK